ncbi:hypothetical protein OIV83_000638 [Microbotryomycetes sp. JL201]|nr:hypothetical protein OIV83_000638 [Microbotryomycetes sp. JL201]
MPTAIDVPVPTVSKRRSGPLRVPAALMRSGTSKGLFFCQKDLPASRQDWAPIILAAMGSPDPYNRQLNGCGGGTSTQSKVAVVGICSEPDVADIDYTFIQVPVNKAVLDFSGNCGNMAAGCGPFAVAEGLVKLKGSQTRDAFTVRIRNTNTGTIINSTFAVNDGYPAEDGEMVISGVAGAGAPIRLDFVNPGGAMTGKLLPTGRAVDIVTVEATDDHARLDVPVTLIDSANPFCFVHASSLGLQGNESTSDLIAMTNLIQDIRAAASIKMGLATDLEAARQRMSVPKIAILAEPATYTTLSGVVIDSNDMDIQVRAFSMGTLHQALQMTCAVGLASACSVPGSIPHSLVADRKFAGPLRFAQPSGITSADHDASVDASGEVIINSGTVYRTARRLMEGNVLVNL